MIVGLAHPAIFWTGLGLVSVPILIHFFFRRRHRVVRWAAMDFLLAALKKQKRRIEIENLILLILRCAAILLLALAVARPAVQAAGLMPFGGGTRAVALVVDTSASMGAQHTGRRALDRARERASRILNELPTESKVMLIVTRDELSGGAPRALLENATPAEARAQLAGIRPGYGPNRLSEVFRLVGQKLSDLRGRRMVVFVTDFQQRDWRIMTDMKEEGARKVAVGSRNENVMRALLTLRHEDDEQPPPVVLLDVGHPETANVVVAELDMEKGREAFAGELLGLRARFVNYGPTPATGTITLYMARADDGRWEKKKTLPEPVTVAATLGVAPPKATDVAIYQRLPKEIEGPARIKVTFNQSASEGEFDRLAADSERYLAVRVRPPVRALPVRSFTGALDILRDIALSSPVVDLDEAIYPADLRDADLSRTDVVVWADAEVHAIDEATILRLEEFVRRGGGLLLYLGKEARPARVNELFFKERGEGLIPMLLAGGEQMREDEEHPVALEIGEKDEAKHPLFWKAHGPIFFSPEYLAYRQVKDFDENDVVARYTSGDPAVLEHKLGRGKIVIVTTTPDERKFRLNGSFLPGIFFFNAAHYLVAEDLSDRNKTVAQTVRLLLPPGARQVVVDPPEAAGGRMEAPVEDPGKPFEFSDTNFPGFYRMTVHGVSGPSSLPTKEVFDVAVNIDAAEGDLRRISPDELRRTYQRVNLHFTSEVDAVLPKAAGSDGSEMSRTLLAGVVGILFLELFLAWRFGRRRRAS